jgi:thioesterase domain-containing protein
MLAFKNGNELKARLSALSPAKRAWWKQRLRKQPIREGRATVVELQAGASAPPVYFIYAGPEEILLAQTMDPRHMIFGIEMPWPLSWRDAAVSNEAAALPTMERLVAPFVAALSSHLGSSPCVLVGWSFAGMMAFEAAHRLQKLGGRVEMVMLIDTLSKPPPFAAWSGLSKRWTQMLDKVRAERSKNLFASHIWSAWLMFWLMCVWPTKRVVRLLERPSSEPDILTKRVDEPDFLTSLVDEQGVSLPWSLVDRLYRNAKELYDVHPLNCRGILFRANMETNVERIDGSLGWKGLFTRGLEIIPLTGDHHAILRDKLHRANLARKMSEILGGIRE